VPRSPRQASRIAGAHTVLASHWKVNDKSAIYAAMVHRKFDFRRGLNVHADIWLTSVNRLTMEEGCYALETVLLWSGIKMVPVGKDTIKAEPADAK
jgi:hypothetical protein